MNVNSWGIPATEASDDGLPALSKEAYDWLQSWSWVSSGLKVEPSPAVVKELQKYRPKTSVELYRFIAHRDIGNEPKKKLKSYTPEKGMVEFMAEDAMEQGKGAYIEWRRVSPKEILVMVNLIPGWKDHFVDEVIVVSP